jgi:hypothetical protein
LQSSLRANIQDKGATRVTDVNIPDVTSGGCKLVGNTEPLKTAYVNSFKPGKISVQRSALWLIGFSIIFHGVVSVWLGPVIAPDSVRYAPLGNQIPSLDLLGTYGGGAPLVQLVWRLTPSLAIGFQAFVSAAAWAFFTYAGLAVIGPKPWRTAWLMASTVLYWSPLIVISDAAALTESLAISGSLACTTGAACLVSERARCAIPVPALCAATVTGFGVAVLSRPVTLIALAPVTFTALFLALRRERRLPLLAAWALVALSIFSYGTVLSTNLAHSPSEIYRAQNRLALRASPEWIEAARRTGFMDCPELRASELISAAQQAHTWTSIGPLSFRRVAKDREPQAQAAVRDTHCRGIVEWLEAGHLTAIEQLIYTPGDSIRGYMADGMRWWSERPLGGSYFLRFQRAGSAYLFLFDVVAVALLSSVPIRAWRLRKTYFVPIDSWALVATAVLSWFGFSVVVWLTDAVELSRHFLPVHVVFAPFALLTSTLVWPRHMNPPRDGPETF